MMQPAMVVATGISRKDARAAIQVHVRYCRNVSFYDIFPTRAGLSEKYKLGRDADDEQVIAAANRNVRLFRDAAVIVIDYRHWNLLHKSTNASCRFAVRALLEFVPNHQVWVRHESGCFERVHHRGWTYW